MRHLVRWIEPETGKNRGKTFKRLEDAREYESQLRRDIRNNDYQAPVNISFDEWVERHLELMKTSPDIDVAQQTINGHKEALDALGRICRPKKPLDVNPKMIRAFRQKLLSENYAPGTINKFIRTIKSALSYAVRDEIVPKNKLIGPYRLCLRVDRKAPRVLSAKEVKALMDAADDPRHKAAISLAYYHGLRRREICNLQWQDVDLANLRLTVVNRQDARTKTRMSRVTAMRPETAKLLARLQRDRENIFVFTKPRTFYWSCRNWFKALVTKTEIPYCTMHDLRKTCNTMMKEAGVPVEIAMQVLGHSSMRTNQQHYTGILMQQQRLAVDSLPSVG